MIKWKQKVSLKMRSYLNTILRSIIYKGNFFDSVKQYSQNIILNLFLFIVMVVLKLPPEKPQISQLKSILYKRSKNVLKLIFYEQRQYEVMERDA